MVRARFFQKDERLTGFSVSGHAGFAGYGQDIACAGVTSAVQTAANTITEILAVRADVRTENGTIRLTLPAEIPEDKEMACQAVLKGLHLQFSLLEEQFSGCVSVKIVHQKQMRY